MIKRICSIITCLNHHFFATFFELLAAFFAGAFFEMAFLFGAFALAAFLGLAAGLAFGLAALATLAGFAGDVAGTGAGVVTAGAGVVATGALALGALVALGLAVFAAGFFDYVNLMSYD